MLNDDGTRGDPVNEYDATQMEEARRRSGIRNNGGSNREFKNKGKDINCTDVTFFVGEDVTLKGRRFRVSHIISKGAVVLEPVGNVTVREGAWKRGNVNTVSGRRRMG